MRNTPDTAMQHTGFRCVVTREAWEKHTAAIGESGPTEIAAAELPSCCQKLPSRFAGAGRAR